MLKIVLSFLLIATFTNTVFAEDQIFSVNIRAMRGSSIEPDGSAFEFDQKLEDLRPQLEHLKFKRYQLLFDNTKEVPLNQVESLDLIEGHKLLVQPKSGDAKKVCLWVQWKDDKGMEVLDTKIHVKNGNSMITGTDMDEANGEGLILAISARPR